MKIETLVIKLPAEVKAMAQKHASANTMPLSVFIRRLIYKSLGLSLKSANLQQGRPTK